MFANRFIEVLVRTIFVLCIALIAGIFVSKWIWLLIGFIPIVILYEGILYSIPLMSLLIAHRIFIVVCVIIIILIVGFILFPFNDFIQYILCQPHPIGLWDGAQKGSQISLGFFFLGVVLGALFRKCIGNIFYLRLLDMPILGSKLMGLSIWAIIIIMFPYQIHEYAGTSYIWGIAGGMIIHNTFRVWINSKMEAYRRLQNIDAVFPLSEKSTDQEFKARVLLKRHRYKKLRNTLDTWKNNPKIVFTKKLTIISASLYRIDGKFRESIKEIDDCLKDNKESQEDVLLLLIKAINHIDLGEDEEAFKIYDQILKTEIGKKCPFVNASMALREAEKVFSKFPPNLLSMIPLEYAINSMILKREQMKIKLNQDEADSTKSPRFKYLSQFIDYSVPVTATLIIDGLGYSYLAAGFLFEARMLFNYCITQDPRYNAALLHLGDYFHLRMISTANIEKKAQLSWHAKLCYTTALNSEQNRKSRITSIAQQRLLLLEKKNYFNSPG